MFELLYINVFEFNQTLEITKYTIYTEKYLEFDTVIPTFTKRVLCLL